MSDGSVFGCIYDAQCWAEKVVVDGEVWVWISRSKFMDELPLVGSWDSFKRRKQLLKEKGLIEYITVGKKQLLRVTNLGKKWNESLSNGANYDSDKTGGGITLIRNKTGGRIAPIGGAELHPNTLTTNTLSVNKKNKQKKESKKQDFDFDDLAISKTLAVEIVDYRKGLKKSINQRGLKSLCKKIVDVSVAFGMTEDDVVTTMMEKSWQSVEVSWFQNLGGGANGTNNQQVSTFGRPETERQRLHRINAESTRAALENGTKSTADHF